LRITSGVIVDPSGASAPSCGEREHGAGASFFFLSFVSTTLSGLIFNVSEELPVSDFTFSGAGAVGKFTFSTRRFHLFASAVGDWQPILFPQDSIEVYMPPANF
jgi:hypothetical protein